MLKCIKAERFKSRKIYPLLGPGEGYAKSRESGAEPKLDFRAVDVLCGMVNLLTQLEKYKAPGPLASLGGQEIRRFGANTHSHCPPRTPLRGVP